MMSCSAGPEGKGVLWDLYVAPATSTLKVFQGKIILQTGPGHPNTFVGWPRVDMSVSELITCFCC